MTDFDKKTRSKIMRGVKSKGNRTTERRFRALLVSRGIKGWHLNDRTIFGTPDFIFAKEKFAVFLDGCFWHGCPKCYRRPKSSRKYWDAKVKRNIAHDRQVNRKLKISGWVVIRIWEHTIKHSSKSVDLVISKLKKQRSSINSEN